MTQTPTRVNPTPEDLVTPTVFDGVLIPLSALVEARRTTDRPRIEGLTFRNCVIQGPAVLVPNSTTTFESCNLGEAAGDRRNLFLKAVGPMIIGGLSAAGCQFESCVFLGVGFAGNEAMIEQFVGHLAAGGAQA
ncbi:MAG: hypothetical protein ACK4JY_12075 [Brevundimonas sp.]|uniref:hypothetical protein n=1 Tax=Brevundimonas sp. TaxID=1871086 RepID=UPI0039188311